MWECTKALSERSTEMDTPGWQKMDSSSTVKTNY